MRSARSNQTSAVHSNLVRVSSLETKIQAKNMTTSKVVHLYHHRIQEAKVEIYLSDIWMRLMRKSHYRLRLQTCTCEHKKMLDYNRHLSLSGPVWLIRLKKRKTLTSSFISTRENRIKVILLFFVRSVLVRYQKLSMVQLKKETELLMSINVCILNHFKEVTKIQNSKQTKMKDLAK